MSTQEVLSVAHPNHKYRWYHCFENVTIEARRTDEGHISYYEVNKGAGVTKRIARETVISLFRSDCRVADRPFLVKENILFYYKFLLLGGKL